MADEKVKQVKPTKNKAPVTAKSTGNPYLQPGTRGFYVLLLTIVISAVLFITLYLLPDPHNASYQKPGESISLPKVQMPAKSPASGQNIQDNYQVTYKLHREVTAHVFDYIITVRKNDDLYTTLQHSSAPIESVRIEVQDDDTIMLKVVALDQIGGESYISTYIYELFNDGHYRIVE